MTLTDEQLAAIEARLAAWESAEFITHEHIDSAPTDIRTLLEEVGRLKQANGELCDFAQRPAEKMLALANAEVERLRADDDPGRPLPKHGSGP